MLLFLHGAGGYEADRPLAEAIAVELGQPVTYPHFPDDDMSFEHQASLMRAALDAVGPDDVVAAHSFGASILLRVLAERERDVLSRRRRGGVRPSRAQLRTASPRSRERTRFRWPPVRRTRRRGRQRPVER